MDEFGELRAAAHGRRDADGFARVFDALRAAYERDEDAAARVALPYAREQLAAWPDAARRVVLGEAPGRWSGCDPALGLARELVVARAHHPSSPERVMWSERVVAWWVEHAGALSEVASADLSGVRLTPAGVRRLVEARGAPGLRRLRLSGTRAQSSGLAALVEASWAPGLEALDVSACRVASDGVRALADAASMSGLIELDLSQNPLDGRAAYLGEDHGMVALERLNLAVTQCRDDTLEGLARLGERAPLRHLDVSSNRLLTDDALARFARSGAFARLESWRCLNMRPGPSAVTAMMCGARAPRAFALDGQGAHDEAFEAVSSWAGGEVFDLRLERVTLEQARALCAWEGLTSLRELKLTGLEVDGVAAQALAERVRRGRLERLEIMSSGLTDREGIALMEACAQAGVRRIGLYGNALGLAFCEAVARMDLSRIVKLDLYGNPLDGEAIEALAAAPTWSSLEDLRVGSPELGVTARDDALRRGGALPERVLRIYGVE